MKKSIVSFLLCAMGIVASATSFAQSNYTATDKGKFYVTAGVGAYPAYWSENIPKSYNETLFVEPSITYSLSIKYFLSKNFALSVGGGYYKVSTKFSQSYYGTEYSFNNPQGVTGWHTSTTGYKYKTLQVFVEGNWVYYRMHKKSRVLYGGVGICVTHTTGAATFYDNDGDLGPFGFDIDENRVKPGITLLGIRGGRKIGWYAELGYGFKGIVNAGLSLRL